MTAYTGKERILAAWKGETTDRVPFNVDIGPHYSPNLNYTINDYFGNIETAIEVQVKSVRDFTSDLITVPQNMMGWFGLHLCYRHKSKPDPLQDGSVKLPEGLEDLEAVPAGEIEGLKLLRQSADKIEELAPEFASRVAVAGPILDAARLVGLEDLIVATIEEPESVHQLMKLCTQATLDRALEVLNNVKTLIFVVADTFASISNISPKIYREFVYPYEEELFKSLQSAAGGEKLCGLHICGFIDPIMEDISTLPLDWIELDGPSSLAKLFEATRGRMVIRGNVGGELFSDGTREQISQAVQDCLSASAGSPKYVLSTGCQIPLNSPLEQVRYFIDTALAQGVRA